MQGSERCLLLTITALLCLTLAATAATLTLDAEAEIDWRDTANFTVEVTGGEEADFDCTKVNATSNYNDYDKTLTAKVVKEGATYNSSVKINWKSNSLFRIETDSSTSTFDCKSVPSSYNDLDETIDFQFSVATVTPTDEVETVVSTYLNFTDKIGHCQLEKLDAEKDRDKFEEKWTACEAEGGEMKSEVKNLREDTQELGQLRSQVSSLSSSLQTSQADMQSCETEKEQLRNKGNNGLIWFVLGAGGVYLLTRKPGNQPPEVDEATYPQGSGEEF